MSVVNKIFICLCCSEAACCFAEAYDLWYGAEACFLSQLNCMGCCWTIFSPICHQCKMGDTSKGMDLCVKGIKLCLYGCAVQCVSPIDGCINCILYQKDNFQNGVKGVSDITKNCKFISDKIREAFKLDESTEPGTTFKTFSP